MHILFYSTIMGHVTHEYYMHRQEYNSVAEKFLNLSSLRKCYLFAGSFVHVF